MFYLYGASGHGKVICEIAELNNISVKGFIDNNLELDSIIEYPVVHSLPEDCTKMLISIGNNKIRKKIAVTNNHIQYLTLIHPSANISKRSNILEGTVVMAGVSINANASIGKHCIINTNASVDHDCNINDYVHISPGAAIAGQVTIGEGTHIGIGASVIQCIQIGKNCTIGAGAVIINNIPDNAVVVGNPGKIIKYNN